MRMGHGVREGRGTSGEVVRSGRRQWALAGSCAVAAVALGAGCATVRAPAHIGEPSSVQGRTYVIHQRIQDSAKMVLNLGGHEVPKSASDDVTKVMRVRVVSSGKGLPTVLKVTYEDVKAAQGGDADTQGMRGQTYTVTQGPGVDDAAKVTAKSKPVDPKIEKYVLQDVFVREPGTLLALITKAVRHPGTDYPVPAEDVPAKLRTGPIKFKSAHLKADAPDSAGHARLHLWIASTIAKSGFTGTLSREDTRVIDLKTGRYLHMSQNFTTTATGSRTTPMGSVTVQISTNLVRTTDFDYANDG